MTVIVIGGGASGMAAALSAAKNGNKVLILERQNRVGRKLLATGNGRCNLTNMNMDLGFFHSQQPEFFRSVLTRFDTKKTLELFHALGLVTVAESSGRVYPLSDQAGSVVDVLRFALDAAGVTVMTGCEVSAVYPLQTGFEVVTDTERYTADKVIICCGGMAGSKLGGVKLGYDLLKNLGHSVTKLYPSLVQIKTDDTYVKSLKGVRADAAVTLYQGSSVIAKSSGEVQFTEYGVSGPAIFEISRAASVNKGGLAVHLDLLRSMTADDIRALISRRIEVMPDLTAENLLTGILHNRLGRIVLRSVGFDLNRPVTSFDLREIGSIVDAIKSFTLEIIDTLSFESAQVTAGGAKTDQFDPETLESRIVPGLYAAGEVLDVDGDCGGYNLQWAWASGWLAGMTI